MENIVEFRFYCDESFGSNVAGKKILTISGFLSDQQTWNEVEEDWKEINKRYGISCFHATDLNGARKEYEGWDKPKRDCYSGELLKSINSKGKKLVAYNCGMRIDEYQEIINEDGRAKLGKPWWACFKTCVAMIAKHMATFPANYQFSVLRPIYSPRVVCNRI